VREANKGERKGRLGLWLLGQRRGKGERRRRKEESSRLSTWASEED